MDDQTKEWNVFVVLEFNQASGLPSIWNGEIYHSLSEAQDGAADARQQLLDSGSGRRERYAVAELTFLDEEG